MNTISESLLNVIPTGKYYEAEIPDTFDLAGRADMAVRGMMNSIDPTLMTIFGLIRFLSNKPFFQHWNACDIPLDTKFAESLPLMRLMSGSDFMEGLEKDFRAELVSRIDDGLYWDRYTPLRPWRNIYGNSVELYGAGRDEDYSQVLCVGRMIRALTAWNGATGSDTSELSASLIRGLRRIAINKDDYSYYPHRGGWADGFLYPRSGWIDTTEAEKDREGPDGSVTCYQGHQIYAAAQVYSLTGDPVAKDLAARLSKYVMKSKFWGGTLSIDRENYENFKIVADAPFRDGSQFGHWPMFFHARAIPLRGLLYYAMVCEDDRALEFVRSAYEYTMTQGLPRMGWINTYQTKNECEGCALGDLIAMAIRLTDAGAGDYWDDVDAVVRNQLAEQQITDAKALTDFCAALPESARKPDYPGGYEDTNDVVNRSLGVFFGTSNPTYIRRPTVMQCCTGNATQGLYYAWEGALRESEGAAVVNLLLNRAGGTVDVSSHLPYEGRVVISVKKPCRVSVRIPRWVDYRSVEIRTNGGVMVNAERLGRHMTIRNLSAGDVLTVTFPVNERSYSYTVNKGTQIEESYDCVFRGSTLVSIKGGPEPRFNDFPIYRNRELLRIDKAPMKKVTRFIADRRFAEW